MKVTRKGRQKKTPTTLLLFTVFPLLARLEKLLYDHIIFQTYIIMFKVIKKKKKKPKKEKFSPFSMLK